MYKDSKLASKFKTCVEVQDSNRNNVRFLL